MRLEDENIQDIAPLGLRMPSALKAKIKSAAKENRHSMNAEIVERLEKSFSEESLVRENEDAIRNDLNNLFKELSNKLFLQVEELKNKK